MIVVYVIAGAFVVLLGLAALGEVFNAFNYKKAMREAKLDRYKRATEEMMKPSLLKTFRGFNFKDLENDEEEEDDGR